MAFNWSSLLGPGLMATGALMDQEPGEALEARQALRNIFSVPIDRWSSDMALPSATTGEGFLTRQINSPSDPFAPGGVYESYLPVLKRAEEDLLSGLDTRYSAAFPSNVGMQGPTVEGLRRATGELAQNRQALIADLLREQQTRQQQAANSLLGYGGDVQNLRRGAARDILQFSRPDQLASAIANLGAILAANQPGGGGNFNLGGLGEFLSRVASGGGQGAGGIIDFISGLFGGEGGGAGAGGIGDFIRGLITGPNGGTDFGVNGPGLLGPPGLGSAQGLASGAGAALAGWGLGRNAGSQIDEPGKQFADYAKYATPFGLSSNEGLQAASAGVVQGAAAGFATGGPIGAVIGAITGAIGGFTGERKARHERKEGSIARETQLTSEQRPGAMQAAAQLLQRSREFDQIHNQLMPEIAPKLQQALSVNDPRLTGVVNEIKSFVAQLMGKDLRVPGGTLNADEVNTNPMGGIALMKSLRDMIATGGIYDPNDPNAANPESSYGLLQSSEVGKFQPGLDRLKQNIEWSNTGQKLYERLVETVRAIDYDASPEQAAQYAEAEQIAPAILAAAQQQYPGITSLDQIPGLRQALMDLLMSDAF